MQEIKTTSGFVVILDDDALDDMELIDGLVMVDRGEVSAFPLVMDMLLGSDKQRLYDHCRGENGRVSAKKVMTELGDILRGLNQSGKN